MKRRLCIVRYFLLEEICLGRFETVRLPRMRRLLSVVHVFFISTLLVAQDMEPTVRVVDSVQTDSLTAVRPLKRFMDATGRKVKTVVRSLDKFDTDYIEPNHYDWTAMVQNTNFFQLVGISARDDGGERQTIDFAPRPAYKIGPYFGWRWIFLGLTVDASRPHRAGKMTEMSLSVYSSRIGGDFVFVRNSRDFRFRNVFGFPTIPRKSMRGRDFEGLATYTVSLNAYYIFNSRRFSYPAAYNQSTVQRRSAGSFLLGFRYDRQKIHFDYTLLPAPFLEEGILNEDIKFSNLNYKSYCVSAGYAYNWVVARNCLVAVSLTPAIGLKHLYGEKITHETLLQTIRQVNFDFVGRLGFVWNTTKHFAGFSLISQLYDYRRNHLSVANSVNYLNLYAGIYFGRKHERKRHKRPSEKQPDVRAAENVTQ